MNVDPKRPLPRVLALLATFNGAAWLDEQLEGIAGQRGVNVAILVSDDGSTDDSVARIRAWSGAHASIALLAPTDRHLGAAASFLRLLREAQLDGVDYVALADQDDIWPPGRLERAIEQLNTHSAAGYSSDAVAFWPDGRQRLLGKANAQRECDYLFEPAGPGCTYVLAHSLAQAVQDELRHDAHRFEGLGYHDWLIYAYARTHGHRWTIDKTPGVFYRQHGHNELGANFGLRGVLRRWRRLTSGWFRAQVLQIGRLWPGPHDEAVTRLQQWRWSDRAWLASNAHRLRRRPRDQVALAVMALLGVLR